MGTSSKTGEVRLASSNDCTTRAQVSSQDLQRGWSPGQRVSTRGRTWTIDRLHRHDRCTSFHLRAPRAALTLLHPFDRFEALASAPRWRRRGLCPTAARTLEAVLAGTSLASLDGGPAPLALPAWQRAVAYAFEDGTATRVLLADAVGLGKTIQAGLAIAALRSCDALAHALVIAPAALRDQWTDELASRLGLLAWTADPPGWRSARAALPPGVNAWAAHPLVITSIDYVKQPDVLAAAAAVPWDLLVVDEAHNAGTGSDRRVAADALAARSTRVLLVTATPHAGDDDGFEALCAIGARHGPAPLLVRRRREDAGLAPGCRLRVLRVPPSAAERAMHDDLREYARQVLDEHRPGTALAMAWLVKRAASSPAALLRSVERRRSLLASSGPQEAAAPWLPFDDEVDERDEGDDRAPASIGVAGLADCERELRLLDGLSHRAAAAAGSWRKGERLVRWLGATGEPLVVFTEYRDTLAALLAMLPSSCPVAVLHGGLGRGARADALGRFLGGEARVLAATDVAGEGLNLQGAARTVVSIEMPWTPSRLEQRVGRVDRIGQRWPARAACLVGRGGPEESVLARVTGRARRAATALGSSGDHRLDELALLASALGIHGAPARTGAPPFADRTSQAPAVERDDAAALAWLVRSAVRRAGRPCGALDAPGNDIPWVRLRRRAARRATDGLVMVFVVEAQAPSGRTTAETAVALHVALARGALRMPVRRWLRALAALLVPLAARAAEAQLSARIQAFRGRTLAEIGRLALDEQDDETTPPPVQAGLFDRRAITEAARRQAVRVARAADRDSRLAGLESDLQPGCVLAPTPVAAFMGW